MTVHFVAVNYRSSDRVYPLADSLLSQSDHDWDLTVVDNSCDPRELLSLQALAERFPRTRIIDAGDNVGYMNALPIAVSTMKRGEDDWLVLMNVDVTLASEGFVSHMQGSEWAENVGVVAPCIMSSATGRDQNPYLTSRPDRRRLRRWRLMFVNVQVARILVYARSTIVASTRRKRGAGAGSRMAKAIYAPHGSLMAFAPKYLSMGGRLDHPLWLFAEEITVAEECRRLGLAVIHDPRLQARHSEHVSTKHWRSIELLRAQSTSIDYITSLLGSPKVDRPPPWSSLWP